MRKVPGTLNRNMCPRYISYAMVQFLTETGNSNNNNKSPSFLSRNIGRLWALSTSVYRLLRTLVHSSSYTLSCLPISSSYFSVFLSSCFLEDSKIVHSLVSLHLLFLTFWRRNYFLILAHPVYKMWIIQEPNALELWNKLHFEEDKTESICHV